MKIFFRILSFPFVLGLYILFTIKYVNIAMYYYLKYGGEIAYYTDKINPITFGVIIQKIIKENETNTNYRT